MVGVSASVNLPLHHKVQKFSAHPGGPGKRVVKRLWWKEYMEKLMNEENEWDHGISAEVKKDQQIASG